jgi:hypothetical protein
VIAALEVMLEDLSRRLLSFFLYISPPFNPSSLVCCLSLVVNSFCPRLIHSARGHLRDFDIDLEHEHVHELVSHTFGLGERKRLNFIVQVFLSVGRGVARRADVTAVDRSTGWKLAVIFAGGGCGRGHCDIQPT